MLAKDAGSIFSQESLHHVIELKDDNQQACIYKIRLISVVDVVITPMDPYQPIPFHILSFAVFQSRILIYAGSNIAEEEKVFERKYLDLVKKSSILII